MGDQIKKFDFRKKKYKIAIVILSIVFVLLFVFYLLYPTLLCDAIRRQTSMKYMLQSFSFLGVNRLTQPEFLNDITAALFESGSQCPLEAACHVGDFEAVQFLLDAGADPNGVGSGRTPIEALYSSPEKDNRLEIAKMLVEYGADVDHKGEDPTERTALFQQMLTINGDDIEYTWENIVFLLQNGASPYNQWGESILFYAMNQTDCMLANKILTLEVVEIDQVSDSGKTAMMMAVIFNNQSGVELLLSYGADKTLTDTNGKTAYDYAVENGHTEIADLLK